jgi:small subunit ribosomal protein S4e
MTHVNRQNIGKFWAVPRKGTKYLAVSSHEKIESMPLVVVLRDVLKIIRNKKELQKSINEKKIQINHKEIRDTNYPVCLFDVINIPFAKKNYKALLSPQINLIHGRNIITDEKVKTGDSIVLDLKDNKIIKIIPMEKGKNAFIIRGKHAGYIGQIKDIMARGGKQIAKIKSDEGKVNVWIKNIIVIE